MGPRVAVALLASGMVVAIAVVRLARSYVGCFFFFQAEDGIRDLTVTGVQTCALPILVDDRDADEMPVSVEVDAVDLNTSMSAGLGDADASLDDDAAALPLDSELSSLQEIGRASCRERV